MCGRYVYDRVAALQEQEFSKIRSWASFLDGLSSSYNVSPTQSVPILRQIDGEVAPAVARWGLIPFYAKGNAGPYSTINARIETLRTSPAYRAAWKRGQRCLLLATGFYEWQVLPDGSKVPWFITCADQPMFGFAGLWDTSTPEGGEAILSCTIVTLPASAFMAEIHNVKLREPAILRREDWGTWLTVGDAEAAFSCLKQYPDELRSAWPVSKRVNSPKNNGPELIQPAAA